MGAGAGVAGGVNRNINLVTPSGISVTGNVGAAGTAGAGAAAAAADGAAADDGMTVTPGSEGPTTVNRGAAATVSPDSAAALQQSAGIINGRGPPPITSPAARAELPRFINRNGSFAGGSNVASWPSVNPGSRVNAVFLEPNATSNVPPVDNVTVLDPAPQQVTTVPAASFESGE